MGLNDTPVGERLHIGFFGCRNVGKSSLVNAITNQDLSVVSNVKGTTTDPVKKSMELLPLGPVMIIDTPGFDDEGVLGKKRVEKTKKILRSCDIAILVTDGQRELNLLEENLIAVIKERGIPYIIVKNKVDLLEKIPEKISKEVIFVSATQKKGIETLKKAIGNLMNNFSQPKTYFVRDFIKAKDIVILVTPIDSAAPKGRMIMPQQLAIRDIIDTGAIAIVAKETELKELLTYLDKKPSLVITDSQVFADIPLTSFSILMARYKGLLKTTIEGVKALDTLKNGSRILISEGCTHHRQCDDIGTVKLPKWIREYTGLALDFEWTSGGGFPEDLSKYHLIIHCGGCMLNSNEMLFRMHIANQQGIPFTNYGIIIAYMNGILERTIFPQMLQ